MTEALEGQHRLQFVLKWTRQRPLALLSLQVKIAPGNLWDELLDHPRGDNDGELVFDMGLFSAGEVTIRFTVGAIAKVPKAAVFIVEDEQKVKRFMPAEGEDPKSLDQGERWAAKGVYTITTDV